MAINKNILVIGDLILDEYIVGENYHISDEAPVPILRVDSFITKLGGAANVANNIKALGENVILCGAIGHIENGYSARRFMNAMEENGLSTSYIVQGEMKTTTKSRVIIQNQQVVRFDYEDPILSQKIIEEIVEKIKILEFKKINLIIISDYRKGIVCRETMDILKSTNIKIVVDPKPINKNYYHDVFCLTPNLKEFNELTGRDFYKDKLDRIKEVADNFRRDFNLCYLVVTLGEKGALYCADDKCEIIGNHGVEVANTIGAGDTFISALCCGIMNGKNVFESVKFANIAASIAVSKKYTGVCSNNDIKGFFDREECS